MLISFTTMQGTHNGNCTATKGEVLNQYALITFKNFVILKKMLTRSKARRLDGASLIQTYGSIL